MPNVSNSHVEADRKGVLHYNSQGGGLKSEGSASIFVNPVSVCTQICHGEMTDFTPPPHFIVEHSLNMKNNQPLQFSVKSCICVCVCVRVDVG